MPTPAITITNKKIKSIVGGEAEWKRFPGFSLLFDNPGTSLSMMGCGLRQMSCSLGTPDLELYTALAGALTAIGTAASSPGAHGLCPLPSRSYHVTVWDGMNDDNVGDVEAPVPYSQLKRFLDELPASFSTANPFTTLAAGSALVTTAPRIRFSFDRLTNWRDKVFVAWLKAADESSQEALNWIKERRSMLYAELFEQFQVGEKLRFQISEKFADGLEAGLISDEVRSSFQEAGLELRGGRNSDAGDVTVTSIMASQKWLIEDSYLTANGRRRTRQYVASKDGANIVICRQKSYNPHVSLGYFANPSLPRDRRPPITHWNSLVSARLGSVTITFESISLYAFTDMATFFKA